MSYEVHFVRRAEYTTGGLEPGAKMERPPVMFSIGMAWAHLPFAKRYAQDAIHNVEPRYTEARIYEGGRLVWSQFRHPKEVAA